MLGVFISFIPLFIIHLTTLTEAQNTQRQMVGLFLLLPLGAQGIRETLRFTSVS
jgi:hypothetical protein